MTPAQVIRRIQAGTYPWYKAPKGDLFKPGAKPPAQDKTDAELFLILLEELERHTL